MSVKLIVNGFFRSGTTIIWRILRDGNPSHAVFYEPCHSHLFGRIAAEQQRDGDDALHSMRVWSEYYDRPAFLEKLRWCHPNLGTQLPSAPATREYVKAFDELDQDCILQPNRWHFVLGDLSDHFEVPALHVIRNPNDVYTSIIENFFNLGSPIKRAVKRLVCLVNPNKPFDLDQMAASISARYDSHNPFKAVLQRFRRRRETFLKVWITSNLQAIRSVGVQNVMVYEDLLSRPEAYAAGFETRYGLQFPYSDLLRGKETQFLSDAERKSLKDEAAALDMSSELDEILAAADAVSLAWPAVQ